MTIEDLEEAVAKLPPEQFAKFCAWFEEFAVVRFDQKIERDAMTGKLDRPADQAGLSFSSRPALRGEERIHPRRAPDRVEPGLRIFSPPARVLSLTPPSLASSVAARARTRARSPSPASRRGGAPGRR